MRVAVVYPELLGTYGDSGNGLVMVERARRRGLDAELVTVGIDDDMPDASIFLLGGGEDGPQRLACDRLAASSFSSRVRDGAHVFAVCAGLQLLGTSFAVEGDDAYEGLGLAPVVTTRGTTRSVGEMAARVGDRLLVGFENHGGLTSLDDELEPLGTVVRGRGNDGHFDGFVTGAITATYAHGPVLAMNPWLCDRLIESVTGEHLNALETIADRLYAQRCSVLAP